MSDRAKILKAIQRESRRIKDPHARRVFRRAAVETGIVESGLSNPHYGDADSQGWRQERASLYKNPTNINASVRRFRQEFEQFYDPGEKSYEVAAQVQRPAAQYLGRYKDVAGQASQVLKSEVGAAPNTRQGYGTTTKTIPGVDRSGDRRALMQTYLQTSHDPDALLNLAAGLRGAQDTPSRTVKQRVRQGAPAGQKAAGVGGPLFELFYGNLAIKNGKPAAPVSGHDDHVHVAAGPNSVIHLGELAQRMGLTVRENPHFDKVDPVHVKGSYHYKNEAIDVSGDPRKLRKFAKRVRRIYNA